MRRALWISLSLVLALVSWSAVGADDGFYVIPSMRGNYAPVPKTGQTTSYITWKCDDGYLQKGVAWPTPRFTDNNNGTVTDNLTKLIWMKHANCIATYYPEFDQDGSIGDGLVSWAHALDFVAGINIGMYPPCARGYSDWRLPNVRELLSLVSYGRYNPALPDTLGTGKCAEGDPFWGVNSLYWSSSTLNPNNPDTDWSDFAWVVDFGAGYSDFWHKGNNLLVWCVRGGK
ncbi:MAG TPA: hypothetical protein DCY27_14415 [Desulfobacterales bacterium]|nr:hypothetical protein [Desulfobacterales bacterium]